MAKPKGKQPQMLAWIVVVRCNLDDVIAGTYRTVGEARLRMHECLGTPGKPGAARTMRAWDDSGIIAVAIYRVRGEKVEHYEQEEFGGSGREAA